MTPLLSTRWCSRLAIVFVSFALLSKLAHWGDFAGGGWKRLHDIAAFLLPIALPLAAGIATALQAALDSGRRSHTYHEMIERLESFGLAIAAVKTESALRRTVYQVEEVLIDEQIEWRTVTSISGH